MPRNRIISQSQAVYVSTGSTASGYMLFPGGTGHAGGGAGTINTLKQLHRIQSANYSTNVTRTDINQYGQLSSLERVILQSPTAAISLDYLVANAYNAGILGFSVDGTAGMASGIFTREQDEKNYFVSTVREGEDAIGNSDADSTKFTIGIGNGYITNFTAAGSVGNFSTESVTIEGLNLASYAGSTGLASPAVLPSNGSRVSTLGNNNFTIPAAVSGVVGGISAIRPGDITVSLSNSTLGPVVTDMKIQSYSLSVPLARTPLNRLGSPFSFSKELQFPIQATLAIEAELGDMVEGDTSAIYANDTEQGINIVLRKPQAGGGGPIAVQYIITGAKLESQSYTSQIGQNKRVSLQFITTIGGPSDNKHNVKISGVLV
ncbi:hypothetical protein [Flavobacterium sp.]|uniref:hypothetical protein n=1 Tax=Flavobacterium sp. TaxID=239 RepID=UPI0038FCDDDE